MLEHAQIGVATDGSRGHEIPQPGDCRKAVVAPEEGGSHDHHDTAEVPARARLARDERQ